MRDSRGVTLIEVVVAVVIVGIMFGVVILFAQHKEGGVDYYCEGPNGVYPGWDPNRPPTVVPNDPNCRVGEG